MAQIATPHAPVTAVLFDYGLVLSGPPDPRAWKRMQQVFAADEAAFHAAYWQPRHPYDRGDLDSLGYWQAVASLLDRRLTEADLNALLEADVDLWTQPNQPMIDWAAQLQATGVRTGILSNIGDAMERGILARCPWLRGFAHHTFSHRLNLAKPELAIYASAAAGLGTAPANILFLDDRADNIAAAREAGMQALQYLDHQSFVREMQVSGYGDLLAPATSVAQTAPLPTQ